MDIGAAVLEVGKKIQDIVLRSVSGMIAPAAQELGSGRSHPGDWFERPGHTERCPADSNKPGSCRKYDH